ARSAIRLCNSFISSCIVSFFCTFTITSGVLMSFSTFLFDFMQRRQPAEHQMFDALQAVLLSRRRRQIHFVDFTRIEIGFIDEKLGSMLCSAQSMRAASVVMYGFLLSCTNLDAPMLSLWTIGELPGTNASLGIRKRSPVPLST